MAKIIPARFSNDVGQMSLTFFDNDGRPFEASGASIFEPSSASWRMLEFFSGSGLVSYGLRPFFSPVWANDNSIKKNEIYARNFGSINLCSDDIRNVRGGSLPFAHLSWASFPCQDLSLAGKRGGLAAERSGLVWEWLRIFDEMPKRPAVVVLENVAGLLTVDFSAIHHCLDDLGYRSGAILINADLFLPQSRPRVFILGVDKAVDLPVELVDEGPNWLHKNKALVSAASELDSWVWWKTAEPSIRKENLATFLDDDVPFDKDHVLELIPERQLKRLAVLDDFCGTAYRRTRNGKQCLEVRFDGVAGCLRTAAGGSSKQFVVVKKDGLLHARVLRAREAARLMGAPDEYYLPKSENDGYFAMGDAVAVPVAEFIGKRFLVKLVEAAYGRCSEKEVA